MLNPFCYIIKSQHFQPIFSYSEARKNFGYSRKLLVKVTPTTAFYQSEVLDPSFFPFFFGLYQIPYFEMDGFVLQLPYSFPQWLFSMYSRVPNNRVVRIKREWGKIGKCMKSCRSLIIVYQGKSRKSRFCLKKAKNANF